MIEIVCISSSHEVVAIKESILDIIKHLHVVWWFARCFPTHFISSYSANVLKLLKLWTAEISALILSDNLLNTGVVLMVRLFAERLALHVILHFKTCSWWHQRTCIWWHQRDINLVVFIKLVEQVKALSCNNLLNTGVGWTMRFFNQFTSGILYFFRSPVWDYFQWKFEEIFF